jgi:hypothetical protein
MEMEHKDVVAEVKELNEKGEGVLRFIKFGQEDKDADVTFPGFIGRQEAILIPAHNWKSDYPPLGRGESFEADGATNFRFKLNLDDPRAKQWHSWLKLDQASGRPLQQVSYGFSPFPDATERVQKDGRSLRYLKPRPDGSFGAKLHEISFVVVGSGNDTAVVAIKESRGMEPEASDARVAEVPVVETPAPEGLPSVEDYKDYPEDRRPPLPLMIKWLRLYRYHIPFLRDIRKRDGKEISPETIREFSDLVQEAVEVATLLNIKVMTSHLMPDVEAEARQKEWYTNRLQELSAEANAEEARKLKQLQEDALALEAKARERARAMKFMFPASSPSAGE